MIARCLDGTEVDIEPGCGLGGLTFVTVELSCTDILSVDDLEWFVEEVIPRLVLEQKVTLQ